MYKNAVKSKTSTCEKYVPEQMISFPIFNSYSNSMDIFNEGNTIKLEKKKKRNKKQSTVDNKTFRDRYVCLYLCIHHISIPAEENGLLLP